MVFFILKIMSKFIKSKFNFFGFIFFWIVLFSCNKGKEHQVQTPKLENENQQEINKIGFSVLNTYSHDINSFTEGLFIENGKIYESTGSPEDLPMTKSVIGILNLESGMLDTKVELDKNVFFGEGIAKCKDKIYQLTYKNKTGFIYNSTTFKEEGSFKFDSDEGWGLTTLNDTTLIMSDGTNNLTFINTNNLKTFRKVSVFENNTAVPNLNELEYVKGYLFANVYGTCKIVKIDISTGLVVGSIDLSSLCYEVLNKFSGSLELNGIAFDNKKNTFLITGKMWPNVYEIKLNE